MNNLRKVTLQEGVTLWYEDDFCVDIDVEPGVESVFLNDIEEDGPGEFCFDNEDKKSFPDVKELHIGKMWDILILTTACFQMSDM